MNQPYVFGSRAPTGLNPMLVTRPRPKISAAVDAATAQQKEEA